MAAANNANNSNFNALPKSVGKAPVSAPEAPREFICALCHKSFPDINKLRVIYKNYSLIL